MARRSLSQTLRQRRLGAELLGAWRLLRPSGYLRQQGWFRSVGRDRAVSESGQPLPWFTYPALHFLEPRLRPHWHVFEYGAGQSTLWWAQRAAQLVSVESDRGWYERLSSALPPNVQLMHRALGTGAYPAAIDAWPGRFHIVVIDGRERIECARHSLAALDPRGVIVWDNADRAQYAEGYAILARAGFKRLDFWGMGPINAQAWSTAIFYRPENVLGL